MKILYVVSLMSILIMVGCTNNDHSKSEEFYKNVLLLKSGLKTIYLNSDPIKENKKEALHYLKINNRIPQAWIQREQEKNGSKLPNTLPMKLLSEWNTPIVIGSNEKGVTVTVNIPQFDCAEIVESLSIEAVVITLNGVEIPKTVGGSALRKASELCKTDKNTLIVTFWF